MRYLVGFVLVLALALALDEREPERAFEVTMLAGRYCEELVLPAGPYTDLVNAICTVGCFDDLDCAVSEFNGLPRACVDHVIFGRPVTSRVCVERCEIDADCDVPAGFGCEFIAGDRLCVPIR